jgi:hypothetical protein
MAWYSPLLSARQSQPLLTRISLPCRIDILACPRAWLIYGLASCAMADCQRRLNSDNNSEACWASGNVKLTL